MSSIDKEDVKHTAVNTESRFLKEVRESNEKKKSAIQLFYEETGKFPNDQKISEIKTHESDE